MGLDLQPTRTCPEAEATAKEQAIAITSHVNASSKLWAYVVGLTGRAKGFQVSNAVGAIWELKDEVKGARHVALKAVDHQL